MSLNRYIKVPSVQSGKFNLTTLNRIDFDLDPNTVYDLDNSWIELNVNVVTEDNSASGISGGTYKVKAEMSGSTTDKLDNSMMVKNCHLRSANNGMLEDIRDVNVLRSNIKSLQDSSAADQGKAFKNIGHLFESNKLKSSLFRELHKEGNVNSRDVQAPIRIKMSELFNLGSMRQFDCRKLGRTRVHIELDNLLVMAPQTAAEMGGETGMEDVSGANNNVNSFIYSSPSPVLEQNKLWVNQVVQIDATGSGGAANIVAHFAKITSITYANDRLSVVTIDTPLASLTSGQKYENIEFTPVVADSASFTIDFAEMVTQVVSQPDPMMDKMSYTTYTTEQFNAGGLTNFQRLYQVEPEAVSLMVLFPTASNNPVSSNVNITDYRLKIDNIDQTDRNVVPHSPLYYNLVNEAMLDAGLSVANLNEFNLDPTIQTEDKRATGTKILSILAKLDQTQREKNIQINITGQVQLINVYKLVVRQV
jgi:hypothetical protein